MNADSRELYVREALPPSHSSEPPLQRLERLGREALHSSQLLALLLGISSSRRAGCSRNTGFAF